MLMTIPFQTENHPNLDVIILRNENVNENIKKTLKCLCGLLVIVMIIMWVFGM